MRAVPYGTMCTVCWPAMWARGSTTWSRRTRRSPTLHTAGPGASVAILTSASRCKIDSTSSTARRRNTTTYHLRPLRRGGGGAATQRPLQAHAEESRANICHSTAQSPGAARKRASSARCCALGRGPVPCGASAAPQYASTSTLALPQTRPLHKSAASAHRQQRGVCAARHAPSSWRPCESGKQAPRPRQRYHHVIPHPPSVRRPFLRSTSSWLSRARLGTSLRLTQRRHRPAHVDGRHRLHVHDAPSACDGASEHDEVRPDRYVAPH